MIPSSLEINQQRHGYLTGHQLLASSFSLPSKDQREVDRLSDIAGNLGPGEKCPDYLTGYLLPSGSHYVLAKTWYDLQAPRAGCVHTHSLFIPASAWQQDISLRSLFSTFSRYDEGVGRQLPALLVAANSRSPYLDQIEESGSEDFVRAFFFEQRAPIVWFGCSDPNLVAARLISWLWPSFRQTLAFCTFVLQPRDSFSGPFDLVFSPAGARPRFSRWTGRKVDSQSTTTLLPNPHWSKKLRDSIFLSPDARFKEFDEGTLLSQDTEGSVVNLRLALLWQDLTIQSGNSLTSELGKLDILNTSNLDKERKSQAAEEIVVQTAQRLETHPDVIDAVHFLDLLASKLNTEKISAKTRQSIRLASFSLVRREPAMVLGQIPDRGFDMPARLAIERGIAESLATTPLVELQEELLRNAPRPNVLLLLTVSTAFAKSVLDLALHTDNWWEWLAKLLGEATREQRPRLRRKLTPFISSGGHSKLLAPLFYGVGGEYISNWVVSRLWVSTKGFSDSAIRSALIGAIPISRFELLQSALLDVPQTEGVDALLCGPLARSWRVFSSLLDDPRVSPLRATSLTSLYLKSRADDEIREISRQSQEFTSKLLQALIRNRNSETTGQILRLFLNGRFKASDVADIVDRLLPSLEQEEAAAVLSRAMPMLLPQLAAVRHDSVSSLLQHPAIEQAANMVGRTTLLNCFVPDGLNPVDADTQSSCLQLLLSTSTVRSLLLERCDEIARRIESRRFIPLTLDGFLCWAKLLDLAFEAKSSTAISGGAIALRHVFANKFLPASSVLVTAFPVIYKLLEKSKFIYELAETFDFFEWDKCKIMRQRLIESYSSADWPPSDLLICAYRSGILDDVISQIRNLNIFIRAKDMLKTNGSLEALKILEIAANSN